MKSYLCHFAEKFEGQTNCRPVGKSKKIPFLRAQFEELQHHGFGRDGTALIFHLQPPGAVGCWGLIPSEV